MRVTSAARLLEDPPGEAALARLRRSGFDEPERAARELRLVASHPPLGPALQKTMGSLLGSLARLPDALGALVRLERFARGDEALTLRKLLERGPRSREALLWALGGSPFLAEQVIRHPEWAEWLTRPRVLASAPGARAIAAEARRLVAGRAPAAARDALRLLRRREVLRIAIRDLLRLTSVSGTLASLSALADGLVEAALEVAAAELGEPPARGAAATSTPGFAVLALGKLGGGELNFSSDVDLVYVHRDARPRGELRRARAGARPPAHGGARGHDRRGPRLSRRPAAAPRGAGRLDLPLAAVRRRVLPLARRNVGAPRAAQGAAARGRPRRRSRAAAPGRALRLEPAVRTRCGRGGAAAQARERPAARHAPARAPPRQARPRRDPRDRARGAGAADPHGRKAARAARARHAGRARGAPERGRALRGGAREARASVRVPARRREQAADGARHPDPRAPRRRARPRAAAARLGYRRGRGEAVSRFRSDLRRHTDAVRGVFDLVLGRLLTSRSAP